MRINELYDRLIAIYSQEYISYPKSHPIEIEENQNDKPFFEKLYINCPYDYIIIEDRLLKNANNSYHSKPVPCLNLECDKILITEKNGKKHVILFELKSTFYKGLSTAIPQLRASCFKIQNWLSCIKDFNFDDYVFSAVMVSWKLSDSQLLEIIKKENSGESIQEREKLAKKVAINDIVKSVIDNNNLGLFYTLPLKNEYLQYIPLYFFTTQYHNASATLDIDSIMP